MQHTLENLWGNPDHASEADALLYRSRLLGSNKSITNFGGGNTSAKTRDCDPLTGEPVDVLWVKGSGGDLGSMSLDGFATLYLDKLLRLAAVHDNLCLAGESEANHDDDIVQFMPHCVFNCNPRAPSIDTCLHAYLPFKHIDHMHPDAIIAIATAADGETLCQQIFGDRIGWLDWQRPGFTLAMQLQALVRDKPEIEGVILQQHGLFTWGEDSQACYLNTINTINQGIHAVAGALKNRPPFSSTSQTPQDSSQDLLTDITPRLRNALSGDQTKLAYFNGTDAVLDFVNSPRCQELSQLGTSCPDHFLRTKIRPLVITTQEILDEEALNQRLTEYRADYERYYTACKRGDSPAMRDSNPVIILIPGLGMLGFSSQRSTARIATEFFANAINVMAGAEALSRYTSLPEQEAFDIEYWLLEEAKLQRMPAPLPLTGKVALVTGAAGGIGSATCRKLLAQGAAVICCDINEERLRQTSQALANSYSADNVKAIEMDVTSESQVCAAFDQVSREFGGIDILVANAGIASAASITDTTLDIWNLNHRVLSTGYFLVAREAFKSMQKANSGCMVFIGSKNALASSAGAAAYSSAKAASLHLARCLALEGAPHHIRVNTVNPDAVIEGSAIWSSEWKQQRAAGYGIEVDELEDFYRNRSLLKVNVTPKDIAEAVLFFAMDTSSRSTGNVLNVDAGNATAFTR